MKLKNILFVVLLGSLQTTPLFSEPSLADTEEKDQKDSALEFPIGLPEEKSVITIDDAFNTLFEELEHVTALLTSKSQSSLSKPNKPKPTTSVLKPASPQEMLTLLELRANKLKEDYSRNLEAIEREAFDKKAELEKKYVKEIQTILGQIREVSELITAQEKI